MAARASRRHAARVSSRERRAFLACRLARPGSDAGRLRAYGSSHGCQQPQAMSPEPTLQPGRCLVIGEVALTHDGSLGLAHAFVDAIADAGADAVKFQTHIAAAESTPDEPWRVKFSQQDATRYDYWKRMEFTEGQWGGLKKHAVDKGLLFLSTPFSIEAVEL